MPQRRLKELRPFFVRTLGYSLLERLIKVYGFHFIRLDFSIVKWSHEFKITAQSLMVMIDKSDCSHR